MGLDVNELIKEYLPPSVRLSPPGAEAIKYGPVYLAEQKCSAIYIMIDTEGALYSLPFSNPSQTYTIRDITAFIAGLVQAYLSKHSGFQVYEDVIVDLRCDRETPSCKALTRLPDKDAPKLPDTGIKDAEMAWYMEFNQRHGGPEPGADVFDTKRAMGFGLPQTRLQARNGSSGTQGFTFENYLRSPGFKRFINRVVFDNVLEMIEFPQGSSGHAFVLARSKHVSSMRTPTMSIGPIPKHLMFSYKEADCAIGAIGGRCRHPDDPTRVCDLFVRSTSNDGDCFLVLAAARNRGMRPARRTSQGGRADESCDELVFENSITIQRSDVHYDINEFYRCIVELHGRKASKPDAARNPLLSAFIPVMMAGKQFDYVRHDMLEGVGITSLMTAYYSYIDYFSNLVTSHTEKPNFVLVDPNALGRLALAARAERLTTAQFSIDESFEQSRSRLLKATKTPNSVPTMQQIRVMASQLSWALSYFSACGYEKTEPDPMSTAKVSGFSLWGFEQQGKDVISPEDVDSVALWAMREELLASEQAEIRQRRETVRILADIRSEQHSI